MRHPYQARLLEVHQIILVIDLIQELGNPQPSDAQTSRILKMNNAMDSNMAVCMNGA